MRRLMILFFLVLFPLQAVWAAAAPYCQHEKERGTFHVGHHAHEHQATTPDGDAQHESSLPMEDGDCHTCHAFCGVMLMSPPAMDGVRVSSAPAPASPPALPAPPRQQPERPDWQALA